MHFACNVECSGCETRWPTHSTFLTEISRQFHETEWYGWCTFCGKSQPVCILYGGEKLDGAITMPHMDFGLTITH